MSKKAEDVSIYAKKYYRVVLEEIDRNKETVESFAIKMSMRLNTPLPRVRSMLKRIPCTVKSGLTITQANKLFAVLEDLGAKASVDSYFLTPGQDPRKTGGLCRGEMEIGRGNLKKGKTKTCPSCGWEEDEEAEYCSICLESFKKKENSQESLPEENPGINPLLAERRPVLRSGSILKPRWMLLAGVVLFLILLFVLKK